MALVSITRNRQLDCEIVTDFAHLESIAPEWQRIWETSLSSDIFQHFAWASAYWQAFGDQLALFTPIVRRGEEIIGILPLAAHDGLLQFIGSPLTDYNDVICADADVADVMNAAMTTLFEKPGEWHTAVLENIPEHARLVRYCSDPPVARRRYLRTSFRCPCATVLLDERGTLASELASKRSFRRHETALRKRGNVNFQHLENRSDIMQHLPNFFRQQISRRALAGQHSQFLDPRAQLLFRALVQELDPHTLLRFGVLELDGQPLAYHFGFQADKRFTVYQPSFDVDYWKNSPGEVLFRSMLQYAGYHKLREFDLTRGGEIYKDRLANSTHANLTLQLTHENTLPRRVQVGLRQANGRSRQLLEDLRSHPRAYRIAQGFAQRTLDTLRRESRLKKLQGRQYTPGLLRRSLRAFVFSCEESATYSFAGSNPQYGSSASCSSCVARASLGELAVFSAANPVLELPLPDLQSRVFGGQELFVVRESRESGDPLEIWAVRLIKDSHARGTMMMVEQCWSAKASRPMRCFREILRQCSSTTKYIMIRGKDIHPAVWEMREAGIAPPQGRFHVRLFRRFELSVPLPMVPGARHNPYRQEKISSC